MFHLVELDILLIQTSGAIGDTHFFELVYEQLKLGIYKNKFSRAWNLWSIFSSLALTHWRVVEYIFLCFIVIFSIRTQIYLLKPSIERHTLGSVSFEWTLKAGVVDIKNKQQKIATLNVFVMSAVLEYSKIDWRKNFSFQCQPRPLRVICRKT